MRTMRIKSIGVDHAREVSESFGCSFVMLGHGKFSLIDKDDEERILSINWHYHNQGYAKGWVFDNSVYLHRFILRAKKGEYVDHANGDKLDNRKSNIRICTQSQNLLNKRNISIKKTSSFKGVSLCKMTGRWIAFGTTGEYSTSGKRKVVNLGRYKQEIDAAKAYNDFVIKNHGEFAVLNSI